MIRKNAIYILAALILLAAGLLIMANWRNRPRRMDERITLRQADKIPYGTAVARSLLPEIFPNATIAYTKDYPLYWDSLDNQSGNQALIMVTNQFDADEDELKRLHDFVSNGNYVFIVAHEFSYDATEFFRFSYTENSYEQIIRNTDDSLMVHLTSPVFSDQRSYVYPGKKFQSIITRVDTPYTTVLGRDDFDQPDFISMQVNEGKFFIHTAPLAFSNYFILHKNNASYFTRALSVIPRKVDKVLWNEYYLNRQQKNNDREPNWLKVLMRYPGFRAALLTALMALILYVLLEMRRKQRIIPPYGRPENASLDFVRTMGRLYYEKRDHKNLAKKMGTYFLDHVRMRYTLSTQELNEQFISKLHFRSGYPLQELQFIVGFIRDLDQLPAVSQSQLVYFHKQLESFYQTT